MRGVGMLGVVCWLIDCQLLELGAFDEKESFSTLEEICAKSAR